MHVHHNLNHCPNINQEGLFLHYDLIVKTGSGSLILCLTNLGDPRLSSKLGSREIIGLRSTEWSLSLFLLDLELGLHATDWLLSCSLSSVLCVAWPPVFWFLSFCKNSSKKSNFSPYYVLNLGNFSPNFLVCSPIVWI